MPGRLRKACDALGHADDLTHRRQIVRSEPIVTYGQLEAKEKRTNKTLTLQGLVTFSASLV